MRPPPLSPEANLRLKINGLPEENADCLVDLYIEMPYKTMQILLNEGDIQNEDLICDIISIMYKRGNKWLELPLTQLTDWDIDNINHLGLQTFVDQQREIEDAREYFD